MRCRTDEESPGDYKLYHLFWWEYHEVAKASDNCSLVCLRPPGFQYCAAIRIGDDDQRARRGREIRQG